MATDDVPVGYLLPLALACAALSWAGLATATLVGRLGHDRRQRCARHAPGVVAGGRRGRRLLRRAASHRSEAGKWRRIAALRTVVRCSHPRSRPLIRRAIASGDPELAGAAVRALGELGTPWAIDELLSALRRGETPRSRVAAQLERFTPAIGPALVPLLADERGPVRFWAATLLGACLGEGREELVAATADPDPNVRAAAVESLGERRVRSALPAVRTLLRDEAWFVRVHACRAVGELGGLDEAPALAGLLDDPWWWVRAAAKDGLRRQGLAVAGALIPLLEHHDRFARNGAAEVLQDVGFVDLLAAANRNDELLERIFAAGGETMRTAARSRALERRREPVGAATA
jgi:HEAT repeat protein